MFAVIFEVQPKPERWDDYLGLAKFLKPEIEKIDGFIDNERFGSKRTEGRLLSLSTWRDEKSVIRWRTLGVHHDVQEKGRTEIFEDYHLRVGEIIADNAPPKGQTLREQRFDETEVTDAKIITISERSATQDLKPVSSDLAAELGLPQGAAAAEAVADQEVFESIYNTGKLLLLVSWRNVDVAKQWTPRTPLQGDVRHRLVRVIRDYSMYDRREAPQYYPDLKTDRVK